MYLANAPVYVTGLFVALVFVLNGLIVAAVEAVSRKQGAPDQGRRATLLTALVINGWLLVTGGVATTGFFTDFSTLPPRVFFVLIPPFLAVLFLGASNAAGRFLTACPEAWLVSVQSFRVLMEVILWLLFLGGVIPEQMIFEGRNFDVLAGLTAPVVAYLCFVRRAWPSWVALVWNFLALGLLANIVTVAILSLPTPFRIFLGEPANTIIAYFPYIWLPAFVVPVALLAHLLSIRQLLTKRADAP